MSITSNNHYFLNLVINAHQNKEVKFKLLGSGKVQMNVGGLMVGGEDMDDAIDNLREYYAEEYLKNMNP